eukprot:3282677-Pleurochrysis_carterae.AAC.1
MRPNLSIIGSCNECQDIKDQQWAAFWAQKATFTADEAATFKAKLFKHAHDMGKERLAAMALHRECAGRGDWLYAYDDKCGSEYTFLPPPR